MRLLFQFTLAAVVLPLLYNPIFAFSSAIAQDNSGAICISAYADMNGNGARDGTESALAGVKVKLTLQGTPVTTYITTAAEEPYCFENLQPGIYTVTFVDSPTYRTTTANEGTFSLAEGQHLTIDAFGALPVPSKWNPVVTSSDVNAICVAAYTDTNANGIRDSGELPLAGVNVNLSIEDVIIATHVTTGEEAPYCFEYLPPDYVDPLPPDIYTVTFTNSPTYRSTTATEGSLSLANGQRVTLDGFGAVPVDDVAAEIVQQIEDIQPEDEPLTTSERLLLSAAVSMVVMIFMIGTGAVLLGVVSGGRRSSTQRKPSRPQAS